MAILMTPMAIARMAEITILAIMATSVMANGNFRMAVRGVQLKSKKIQLSGVKFIRIGHFVQTLTTFL